MPFERVNILGIDFDNVTMLQMMEQYKIHLKNEDKVFVVTGNPEIIMYAYRHPDYRDILNQATYTIPDGIGIVKASKLLKKPLAERVTGFDTLINLLELANEEELKVYLLGSKEDVLGRAIDYIRKSYPNVNLVGSHHGFFDWNDPSIKEEIKKANPDMVFVGMGFPLQEQWISQHLHEFNKGIFIGVGGSFDVLAGVTKRAPKTWQRFSAEWLYRFIQRPTRGKRMIALPLFAVKVLQQKVKGIK